MQVSHYRTFSRCNLFYQRWTIFYMFLTAVGLPSVFLVATYGTIVAVVVYRQHKLHSSVVPATGATVAYTAQQEKASRRWRRTIRVAITCAVVTLMFLVCWLPVWFLALMLSYDVSHVTVNMVAWTNMLNYVHAFINPVIYFIADERFRSVLVRIFCRKHATAVPVVSTIGTNVN